MAACGDLWPKKNGQLVQGFEHGTLSSSARPLATKPFGLLLNIMCYSYKFSNFIEQNNYAVYFFY